MDFNAILIQEEQKMYIADKYWNNYIGDTDDKRLWSIWQANRKKYSFRGYLYHRRIKRV